MTESIHYKILRKIKKARRGALFFPDSFTGIATPKTAAKTLERLVQSGELVRVAKGIYTRPRIDPVIGVTYPDIEEISSALARRDKARIVSTGSYALYKLGLTTQVPLNVVFYTDGSARKVTIGNQVITFKRAAPKNLAALGSISKLAIQALRTIGKDNVTPEQIHKIRTLLKDENEWHLEHDLKLAPDWIRRLLSK
ncbi:DUF6088 family protein [Natronogracilivirga saccharolytica]|uniref:Type IV toxin-antitoxin system AbiEi family antitoxin domain-containing protein n=1 Tax=Natronogracilivirga saccharolytica TaxID=2812953 RepID=A0A8J7UX61_9BACT|nr:DUF6088 family protein [Natronogracilivirga saccharolytica]MBP3192969.1 type IV toxin-antitoxin system AbiEi family antitoxin domain-containing protein [Natronogracilivirga saccharolytica]